MLLAPDVRFTYLTGLPTRRFANPRLRGSWDEQGRPSATWSERPMPPITAEDGCPGFEATVAFPASAAGTRFEWEVIGDGPAGAGRSLIAMEEDHPASRRTVRSFVLRETGQTERYHLVLARRELLVVASFANRPFDAGYVLENAAIPDAAWREVLNSDQAAYGGAGVGNGDAPPVSSAGRIEVIVPASGLVVLEAR